MRKSTVFATTLVCSALWAAVSQAESWEHRVTPYLWLPTMSVDTAIGSSPPASSDTNIMDVLEFGFLVSGEAWKGDWGVLGEFNYLSLKHNATFGNDFDARIKLKGVMGSAAVGYRLVQTEEGSLDAFGGARLWWMEPEVAFDRLPTVSDSKTWVDPIFGLRGRYRLSDSVYLSALGDIGGFGVGSHFQWELIGTLGYRIDDSKSIEIGWRHLATDYDSGNVDLNVDMTGPLAAVNIVF